MNRAKAVAYNQGVLAVLDIAASAAAAIRAVSQRPAEAFAVVALEELAETGRTLLMGVEDGQMEPPTDTSA